MFKLEVPGPEGMVCNFDISQVDGDVSMIFFPKSNIVLKLKIGLKKH